MASPNNEMFGCTTHNKFDVFTHIRWGRAGRRKLNDQQFAACHWPGASACARLNHFSVSCVDGKNTSRTSNRCKDSQNLREKKHFSCENKFVKIKKNLKRSDETNTSQTQKTLAINQMEMDDRRAGHNLLISFFCVLQLMSKLRRCENVVGRVCALFIF